MEFRSPNEAFAIEPIVQTIAVCASIAGANSALIYSSTAYGCKRPVSVFSAPGDDVDDSIDGVSSPYRPDGATNDFNSFDVLKQSILNLPIYTGIKRRIDTSAVDQHKHGF